MDNLAEDFARLMERLRAGDPAAPRELFETYGAQIQLVVRHRLHRRLRSQFDSMDFSQDAWASFFHIPADQYTFDTPAKLVAFLTRIAQRKVFDAYRQRLHTAKHNQHVVERLRPATDNDPGNEPPARQPTPSQLFMAEERWELLLRDAPPVVREAAELLRQGHSQVDIADRLQVPVKLIQRLIRRLERNSS